MKAARLTLFELNNFDLHALQFYQSSFSILLIKIIFKKMLANISQGHVKNNLYLVEVVL